MSVSDFTKSPNSSRYQKKLKLNHSTEDNNENENENETMSTSEVEVNNALDLKALNRFSRQNAALGAETTAKLIKMKVLIYGLRGIGMETAKNLALQGAGSITVCDNTLTTIQDVGSNFFLQRGDVGKSRASVVAPKLKDLNPICNVSIAEEITEAIAKTHSAVVITQFMPLPELVKLNNFCRGKRISFFFAGTGGVSGDLFVDHGPDHIVFDFTGERPIQKLINEISTVPDSHNETLIRYETPEGNQEIALSGGTFEVSEAGGMESMNGKVFPVTHPYSDPVKTVRIPLAWTQGMEYKSGGLLTEKKLPTKYPMDSLETKLKNPGDTFAEPPSLVLTDLINFGSETQQHVAWYATQEYAAQHNNRLPPANDAAAAAEVLACAKTLLANRAVALEGFDLDEAFVTRYALHIGAELQPMAAFLGGVLAQEVVKSTGKFTPIPGFMHFTAAEALPNERPSAEDTAPRQTPLDDLASVYGWPFVEELGNVKYFMVGCGALGCEFMKNFALNGVCCGPEGKLVVTDADRIELSNLTRQFLFREHNVGQSKAKAAATMAQVMNPDFKVEALELFVGPKTENVFHDEFWIGLTGVCNALDNMEARMYVDTQCVKYEKSLLESGTMGTSGNVDTICPFKTRTYRDGGNAAEGGGVPMCTLRNFPHLTDHCIEWARDQFEALFVKLGKNFETYLTNPSEFDSKMKDKVKAEAGSTFAEVRSLTSLAHLVATPSIGAAAQLAFDIFHFLFRDKIKDLQTTFPADARITDSKTGVDKGPFWGEKKRYPKHAMFNADDSNHTDFVLSATCLFAVMVGLIPPKKEDDDSWLSSYRNPEFISGIVSGLSLPIYIGAPVTDSDIETAGKAGEHEAAMEGIVNTLLEDLRQASSTLTPGSLGLEVADFEKDDDLNFHISFVTSASNLRCDNYSIKRTDFHECKVIAGKIIAAIATTTAAVCGLVILELFKLQLGKDTGDFMNRAIGLAQYTYTSFTQEPPVKFKTHIVNEIPEDPPADAYDDTGKLKPEYITKVTKRAYPENHSVWDKLVIDGKLTLDEFVKFMATEHKLKIGAWDLIIGEKDKRPVNTRLYPPTKQLDYKLIPALELNIGQVMQAIMKNPVLQKDSQKYIALWRNCKAMGVIPEQPPNPNPKHAITGDMTLVNIMRMMSTKTAEALELGMMDMSTFTDPTGRKFVLIPGPETPVCTDLESGDSIDYMCALKIMLE